MVEEGLVCTLTGGSEDETQVSRWMLESGEQDRWESLRASGGLVENGNKAKK